MGRRNRSMRRDRSSSCEEEKKEIPSFDGMDDNDEALPAIVRHSDETADDDTESQNLDDPYTYSDDSASLSDAYFFPQAGDSLAGPLGSRGEPEVLHPYQSDTLLKIDAIHSTYYGTMSDHLKGPSSRMTQCRTLWVSEAIHEDQEQVMVPPISYDNSQPITQATNDRKRQQRRRLQRRNQRLKTRQVQMSSRERRVMQIKGRPQSMKRWQRPLVALLFVAQLLCVICSSVFCLYSSSKWIAHSTQQHRKYASKDASSSSAKRSLEHRVTAKNRITTQGRRLTDLHHNATTGQEQYTDDDETKALLLTSPPLAYPDRLQVPIPNLDYHSVLTMLLVNGLFACLLSIVSFGCMLILVRAIVPIMLIVSVLLALAWGLIGMTLDPYGVISILSFVALLVTLTYTIYNWGRIPFAATNLHTALCALRCSVDVFLLGIGCLMVSLLWCLVWSVAFLGAGKALNFCNLYEGAECDPTLQDCNLMPVTAGIARGAAFCLLLVVSFLWTCSVIKNVVRTTVASLIGTWWYYPSDVTLLCTPTIGQPLVRSLTKSFGSICLASLVTPFASFFSLLVGVVCCFVGHSECLHQARRENFNKSNNSLEVEEGDSAADSVQLGSAMCRLIHYVTVPLRSCNRWSFTYMGMYGYGFPEAGEKALLLFETREWLEVVSDELIRNVLLIVCVIIAGCTGTFAVFVEKAGSVVLPRLHLPTGCIFLMGLFLGYALSSILLLGVVESALNSVLVCFAAGPFEFDKNHPRLSYEMRAVWSHHVWS